MKELRAWQQQAPRDFTVVFEKLLTKSQRTDQEEHLVTALDLDRRRVTGFFGNIQTLFEGGVIDEGFAKRTFGGGTYWFLRDVEAPMDHAKLEAMLEMKPSRLRTRELLTNTKERCFSSTRGSFSKILGRDNRWTN
jgi:hypothetical protein